MIDDLKLSLGNQNDSNDQTHSTESNTKSWFANWLTRKKLEPPSMDPEDNEKQDLIFKDTNQVSNISKSKNSRVDTDQDIQDDLETKSVKNGIVDMSSSGKAIVSAIALVLGWSMAMTAITLASKRALNSSKFSFPITISYLIGFITSLWAIVCHRIQGKSLYLHEIPDYFKFFLPLCLLITLQKTLSLIALKDLDVTLHTIFLALMPLSVLFWALLLRVERFTIMLLSAIVSISFGVGFYLYGYTTVPNVTKFIINPSTKSWFGMVMMSISVFIVGIRWALGVFWANKKEYTYVAESIDKASKPVVYETMDPITMMIYTLPIGSVVLMPFVITLEGPALINSFIRSPVTETAEFIFMSVALGTMTFWCNVGQWLIIERLTSITLSKATFFVQILSFTGGIILFHERINSVQLGGFLLAHFGFIQYIGHRCEINGNLDALSNSTSLKTLQKLISSQSGLPGYTKNEKLREEILDLQEHIDSIQEMYNRAGMREYGPRSCKW